MAEKRLSSQVNNAGTLRQDLVPVGMMSPFPSSLSPVGWLECDGSVFNTAVYKDLFSAINSDRVPLRKDINKIGSLNYFFSRSVPDGFIVANGLEISRVTYKDLWEWAQANFMVLEEAQWQERAATQESIAYFSDGDGSTTFRLPKLESFVRNTTNSVQVGEWQKGTSGFYDTSMGSGHWIVHPCNQVDTDVYGFRAKIGVDIPLTSLNSNDGVQIQATVPDMGDGVIYKEGITRPNSVQLFPCIQFAKNTYVKWWIKAFHTVVDAAQVFADEALKTALSPATTVKYGTVELGQEVRIWSPTETNFYLSATGNDSNSGLTADSPVTNWSVLRDIILKRDFRGAEVNIWLDGVTSQVIEMLPEFQSCGASIFNIDSLTESAPSTVQGLDFFGVNARLGSLKISTLGGSRGIITRRSRLEIIGTVLITGSGSTEGVAIHDQSLCRITGEIQLTGGYSRCLLSASSFFEVLGRVTYQAATVTDANALASYNATIVCASAIFSGTCSGRRYLVFGSSSIYTNGKGENFIPGTTAGTSNPASGGYYT